jgi:DNA-binding XRE family transcriptional regulator
MFIAFNPFGAFVPFCTVIVFLCFLVGNCKILYVYRLQGGVFMWAQVGAHVAKLRTEQNLSKAQFGKLLGVTGQCVGKIEKGGSMSAELIVSICRTMNISADYILLGNADPAAIAVSLKGLTHEQIEIAFDILKRVAQMVNTEDGNEALILEVLRQK